jgi:E3 Ubiquitin ligase
MMQVATILAGSFPGNTLAAAIVGSAGGVYLFYRGFRLLRRRRLILNTPASKIRSASIGLVEVNGLATGPYVITSPLKQDDCFFYRSIAWELRQQGRNSKWEKIGEESLHVPFFVDDGTGTLLIDPRGAEMDLHCDFREEYNNSLFFRNANMSGAVSQFLLRHGANFERRLKVEEYSIKPKNFLFILGTLAQNPGVNALPATPPLNSAAPKPAATSAVAPAGNRPLVDASGSPLVGANYRQVIHLTAEPTPVPATEMTQQQRVAAALMKAGINNPAAWLAAGVAPEDAAQPGPDSTAAGTRSRQDWFAAKENTSPTNARVDLHPPVVLMKGTHEPTFLISWQSQREVLSALGWKSALMIWGGPALTLFCVYILLAHFNGL